MKRVRGYISVRPIGCYNFDFYVEDDATDDDIKKSIDNEIQMSFNYTVEGGYKKRIVEEYYKDQLI